MSSYLLKCLLLSAVAANVFAQAPTSKLPADARKLIRTDIYGNTVHLNTRKVILIVAFSPFDCARCLEETELWNSIHSTSRDVQVLAVVNAPNRYVIRNFIKRKKIQFPVYYDSTGYVRRSLTGVSMGPRRFVFKNAALIREEEVHGETIQSEAGMRFVHWLAKVCSKR